MKPFLLPGTRVAKTGISIFITAWICVLLDWPPVFAVITAIVTLEPTVSDSIKKGLIRFPASAIGSAYSVFFISVFGNSPTTYTLAAVFTIATCYGLRLHAGLLVATLTAVAMVEVIHTNYLISFFIRLGTTTTGLVVSTVVNLFIMPPEYTDEITSNVQKIRKRAGTVIRKVFRDVLDGKHEEDAADRKMMARLDRNIKNTETLIRFQKDETKYHPLAGSEKFRFATSEKQLLRLQSILYHMENLIDTPFQTISWTEDDKEMILKAVNDLGRSMKDHTKYDAKKHENQLKRLTTLFWEDNEKVTKNQHPTHFPPELIVLYELISVYQHVDAFYRLKESQGRNR